MAEQEMGAKAKGVSSDDLIHLSDDEYHSLLEEALSIKSVSLKNKSPMMQTLLKEVAKDDDDFPSNVREMIDAVKETNLTLNKKSRIGERRRAKDDQQRIQNNSSVAARSIQGGSLQNLSGCDVRKSDSYAGGEGKGRGKLQKSGSVNSFISAAEETRFVNGPLAGKLKSGDLSKYCYGSFDGSVGRTRNFQKQTRRKSTSACYDGFSSGVAPQPVNCAVERRNDEIEMMEIDGPEVRQSESPFNETLRPGHKVFKANSNLEEVDKSISLPLHVDGSLEERSDDILKVDSNIVGLDPAGDHEENAQRDDDGMKGLTLSQQNKKKKTGRTTDLMICNELLSVDGKIDITRSQLDVNGNPLSEHLRNTFLPLQSTFRRNCHSEPNSDTTESSSELDKRRKKRNKQSSTRKEMKAGDIQGNRGDDPLESLVEFINSTDKKTIPVSKQSETNTKATNIGLKNNKVCVKTKKQEKENNKKNLPSRLSDESAENDITGSIYDLLHEALSEKTVRNSPTELEVSTELSEHVNGTVKMQTVRKAHSWEGANLPLTKTLTVGCDVNLSAAGVVSVGGVDDNETCELSSFASDFYEDVSTAETEFRVFTSKRHRRNNNRSVPQDGDDRDIGRGQNRRRGFAGNEDMMLLARLPISHRSQRGSNDTRRKSTSSMPPSDHSSVDNSDLDSVHSLPVKSTTTKPAIAKTSSSSSSTPQASYADIAKMAAAANLGLGKNCVRTPPPPHVSFQVVVETEAATEMPLPSLPQRAMSFLRAKRDASTCTTDDIPVGRKQPPITHWASYPTLAEATGKNEGTPTGNVLTDKGGESRSPSDEVKNSNSNTPNQSFSSPEGAESSVASATTPDSSSDQPCGGESRPSCSAGEMSPVEKKEKKIEEVEKPTEEGVSSPPPQSPALSVAVTMPPKPGTKKRKETMCSPATTNSSSSEASGTSEGKGNAAKGNRKVLGRNLPPVVIMNKYNPGTCPVDVSFGFEVNEQLLQRCENPVKREDIKEERVTSPEIKVDDIGFVVETSVELTDTLNPACDQTANPTATCSSDSEKAARNRADQLAYNYDNVILYHMQSWENVLKDKNTGARQVTYYDPKTM